MPTASAKSSPAQPEWFAQPDPESGRDGTGLRFSCTLCGNCCSGPEGYVLVTDAEIAALARRVGLTPEAFTAQYTHMTSEGRSLKEKRSDGGLDCVFLDRQKMPGKAVCGVYEDRPAQCRTWPFWPSVLKSRRTWEQAKRVCPGMDQGKKYDLVQIRVARDSFDI
jgi:Fe-S-cluster containining protein